MVKLSDLTEQTNVADDDVLHLRTAGGVDHRITGYNARKELSRKVIQVTTKTALVPGDPVCISAGEYGKFKAELLDSALLHTLAIAANPMEAVIITKDETTGKSGVVYMGDVPNAFIRIGQIDSDGITFLTPVTAWPNTVPVAAASSRVTVLAALPGGRHRFLACYLTNAGTSELRAIVGEWDGATGFTWLTAEYTITKTAGTRRIFVVYDEDPSLIFMGYAVATTAYGQVLQFAGGALSSYVAETNIGTIGSVSQVHGGGYIGDGVFSMTTLETANQRLITCRLTSVPSLVAECNKIVSATAYQNPSNLNLGPNNRGVTPGHEYRFSLPGASGTPATFSFVRGSWTNGDFTAHADLTSAKTSLGFSTHGHLVSDVDGHVVLLGASGFVVTRWRGLEPRTLVPFTALTCDKFCTADVGDGLLAFVTWETAGDTFTLYVWRVPRCVGVSLGTYSADDTARVLVAGADEDISIVPTSKEWSPISGEFESGEGGGFDVQLKKVEDGVLVEQI